MAGLNCLHLSYISLLQPDQSVSSKVDSYAIAKYVVQNKPVKVILCLLWCCITKQSCILYLMEI